MPATKRSPEGSSKSKPDRTVAQLDELQRAGKDGDVALPGRVKLHVSSLDKVWFPKTKRSGALTKGDVMRYYARVAPYILPALKDRPLSLKRFPNGIEGEFFFQQKAPPNPPAGVRVETVESERGEKQERLIGGSLSTLLYCTQIGAFECNPWNARVQSLEHPDFTVIDLDPGPKAPFRRVIEIALWVKEALDHLGLHGVAKTSGATGMHIVLPLPRSSTESTAERVAQVVATAVAGAHPKAATVERSIAARGDAKVYVDFGQNAREDGGSRVRRACPRGGDRLDPAPVGRAHPGSRPGRLHHRDGPGPDRPIRRPLRYGDEEGEPGKTRYRFLVEPVLHLVDISINR